MPAKGKTAHTTAHTKDADKGHRELWHASASNYYEAVVCARKSKARKTTQLVDNETSRRVTGATMRNEYAQRNDDVAQAFREGSILLTLFVAWLKELRRLVIS